MSNFKPRLEHNPSLRVVDQALQQVANSYKAELPVNGVTTGQRAAGSPIYEALSMDYSDCSQFQWFIDDHHVSSVFIIVHHFPYENGYWDLLGQFFSWTAVARHSTLACPSLIR